MPEQLPKLLIVIASTRPGRVGLPVGRWFESVARDHGAFEVEVVDLAELSLPFLDEPHHPRLRNYTKPHTQSWSATVERADALVFVTAEYNYGYPAALKNAIDFLHVEWQDKALGFVAYGGIAAGTRSMQQLKPVVLAVKMVVANEAVNIPFIREKIGDDGELKADDGMHQAATAMLDELLRLDGALRLLRVQE
jgi:NAD(P)H-dependent FMN reductase